MPHSFMTWLMHMCHWHDSFICAINGRQRKNPTWRKIPPYSLHWGIATVFCFVWQVINLECAYVSHTCMVYTIVCMVYTTVNICRHIWDTWQLWIPYIYMRDAHSICHVSHICTVCIVYVWYAQFPTFAHFSARCTCQLGVVSQIWTHKSSNKTRTRNLW